MEIYHFPFQVPSSLKKNSIKKFIQYKIWMNFFSLALLLLLQANLYIYLTVLTIPQINSIVNINKVPIDCPNNVLVMNWQKFYNKIELTTDFSTILSQEDSSSTGISSSNKVAFSYHLSYDENPHYAFFLDWGKVWSNGMLFRLKFDFYDMINKLIAKSEIRLGTKLYLSIAKCLQENQPHQKRC